MAGSYIDKKKVDETREGAKNKGKKQKENFKKNLDYISEKLGFKKKKDK